MGVGRCVDVPLPRPMFLRMSSPVAVFLGFALAASMLSGCGLGAHVEANTRAIEKTTGSLERTAKGLERSDQHMETLGEKLERTVPPMDRLGAGMARLEAKMFRMEQSLSRLEKPMKDVAELDRPMEKVATLSPPLNELTDLARRLPSFTPSDIALALSVTLLAWACATALGVYIGFRLAARRAGHVALARALRTSYDRLGGTDARLRGDRGRMEP